jgi:hypothetical protein
LKIDRKGAQGRQLDPGKKHNLLSHNRLRLGSPSPLGAVFSESKMGLSAKAKTDSSTCFGILYSDSDVGTPATETWHLTSPPRVTDVGTPHHGPTTADLAPSITARRHKSWHLNFNLDDRMLAPFCKLNHLIPVFPEINEHF